MVREVRLLIPGLMVAQVVAVVALEVLPVLMAAKHQLAALASRKVAPAVLTEAEAVEPTGTARRAQVDLFGLFGPAPHEPILRLIQGICDGIIYSDKKWAAV